MNKIARGLLSYLKKTNQESLLPLIVEELKTKIQAEKDTATVFSPCSLSLLQKQKAVKLAQRLTGLNNLKTKFAVDANLIDGLKVRLDDRVWDLSLASQINQLKDKLNETD